jgi:hypothetical protein
MHMWDTPAFGMQGVGITETIQVVLRLYASVAEVLVGFDCDTCSCAYDGREVLLTPRCHRALERMVNILNPIHAWPNRPSYELRLAKYACRGFAVAVPGRDRFRVDHSIYNRAFPKLKGLARLLRIAFDIEKATNDSSIDPSIAPEPRDVSALRPMVIQDTEPVDLLLDDRGCYDEMSNVMVPSVYCSGEASAYHWFPDSFGHLDNFPLCSQSRDPAWLEIADYRNTPSGVVGPDVVPYQLKDAWSDSSKSREILNMKMDREDVDNLYYSAAYKVVD